MSRILGIDLGNTNVVAATIWNGSPMVVMDLKGKATLPSIVGFKKDGSIIIGKAANHLLASHPERVFSDLHSKLGTDFETSIDGKRYHIIELVSLVLQQLKAQAESEGEISEAVIAVPFYFNDAQRTAVRTASEIAGMNVARIINDTTAAALAYKIDEEPGTKTLVWHLGGSSFSLAVIESSEGAFNVLASAEEDFGADGPYSTEDICKWMSDSFQQMMDSSGLTMTDMDKVILTGGGAGRRKIRKLINNLCRPVSVSDYYYEQMVVAVGAAIQTKLFTNRS